MKQAERYLTDGLRRLADEMPPAHVDFETVRRQADHRPTRTALLAVAAVVVAIALPVGAIYYLNKSDGTPQPAATTSTPSEAPLPTTDVPPPTDRTPTPGRTVSFSLADLTVGASPALAYYSGGRIYSADGRAQVEVNVPPEGTVSRFVRNGDGWIVLVQDQDLISETRFYDATGSLVRAFTTPASSIARGRDGSAAVSMKPGEVTLFDADGNEVHTWVLPDYYRVSPISVLPDSSVIMTATARSTRSAVTLRALPDGGLEGLGRSSSFSVNPANLDRSIPYFCFAVLKHDPTQPPWEACPYMLDGVFSPDGRYVVARVLSGTGTQGDVRTKLRASIGILDADTGAVVVSFEPRPQPHIASLVWEDDTHALVMVYSQPTWSALRVGVDGSVEKVATVDLDAKYLDFPKFEGAG